VLRLLLMLLPLTIERYVTYFACAVNCGTTGTTTTDVTAQALVDAAVALAGDILSTCATVPEAFLVSELSASLLSAVTDLATCLTGSLAGATLSRRLSVLYALSQIASAPLAIQYVKPPHCIDDTRYASYSLMLSCFVAFL
jgi:hypothetical protein